MTHTTPEQAPLAVGGATPIVVDTHTMSPDSLLRYLTIKVHHLIQEHEWDRIHIVGGYHRTHTVSRLEKTGKLFNWQRPTAKVEHGQLVLSCFPGIDYVHHYALITATYLSMVGCDPARVTYRLPTPQDCQEAVGKVEVDLDGDLVVLGWGLEHLAPEPGEWTYGPGYAWKRTRIHGRRVLYLGFLHSIWGDVAGRVVARLAALGAGAVVYVGKVGALDASIVPNTRLATGNISLVDGIPVVWDDFFDGTARHQAGVSSGVHVTSPSVLLENRDWLERHHQHAFVDPEIGPMGAAAHAAGIRFGYLHVISNNLARHYPQDLSNERHHQVIRQRAQLLDQIRATITMRLSSHR